MFYNLLIFLFIVTCVILVLVVLMQSDKSSGLSGNFGAVSSIASSTFGSRETATFLNKFTIVLVSVFFALSILIGIVSKSEFSRSNNPTESIIMQKGNNAPALPAIDGTLPKLDNKKEKDLNKQDAKPDSKKTNKDSI